MLALTLNDISKTFASSGNEDRYVFTGITLSMHAGEILVVRGPNGCGKSTILNIIAGLIPATTGTVRGDGFSYPDAPVAYMFQNYSASLLPWMNVQENITLPLRLLGLSHSDRAKALDSLLRDVGFDQLPLQRSPITLSGGQQQKVCILRAMMTRSPLLLMDEPFSSLDRNSKLVAQDLVSAVRARGDRIVVLVVHDLDDAIALADRVICLNSSPTRVVADVSVPLPWPRRSSIRTERPFLALREQILRLSGEL